MLKQANVGYAMSRRPQSKDEALEALDFIVNVLKEHEKELDKLIGELGTVTEQIGVQGDLAEKVEKVEKKITNVQDDIANLVSCLSTQTPAQAAATLAGRQPRAAEPSGVMVTPPQPQVLPQATVTTGPPVILRCKQWEDFQNLAVQAQTTSFTIKEAERTFQIDALKGNQIVTYVGQLPNVSMMIKSWLSKQLGVSEQKILEGVLAIG
jgi:small-conductance mechanosensitive channel